MSTKGLYGNAVRAFALVCLLVLSLAVRAEVRFEVSVERSADGATELVAKGAADEGWHVAEREFVLENAVGAELLGGIAATDTCTFRQRLRTEEGCRVSGYFRYTACSDEMCLAPKTVEFLFGEEDVAAAANSAFDINGKNGTKTVATASDAIDSETVGAWWRLLALGFAGGLLALLTPCVWPVIPLTVSFFLRRPDGKGRGMAFLYGASIVVIFLALGAGVTAALGASAMNRLATDAVFNVACFLFLVAFGLALLGLFPLRLPQSWADKLDTRAESVGGALGVFLMALTLVVVSFSCTAPIVGAMLVGMVSEGDAFAPLAGMTGFALALALPFTLFALFPGWLKRLPKSGEWMSRVKVWLGVFEVAFALKFLSVADMAYGWGLLPRRLFLGVWGLLSLGLGLYMLWSLRHSVWRAAVGAALPLVFAVYLVTGLFGAPCTLVAAFAPPMETAAAHGKTDRDFGVFDEIVDEARKAGKPLFVDFTGYGCVNCRKMEAAVFTDERVKEILEKDFYYIALHVDDRTPLPAVETVTVNGEERRLRTVGDRWAVVEETRFGSVSQPMYVVVDAGGRQVGRSRGYDEDTEEFLKWLRRAAATAVNKRN